MSNLPLETSPALPEFEIGNDELTLKSVSGKSLVSVAIPIGGRKKLAAALKKSYGVDIPDVGYSKSSKTSHTCIFGMQPDQMFFHFDYGGNNCVKVVAGYLGELGYYSDQSDSWVELKLFGPRARLALERICHLDLHCEKFTAGMVTRTQMEHIGVIIHCDAKDSFTLFAARSSAESFYHAITTSMKNIQ